MNNIIDIQRTESSPTEPCTLTQAKSQLIITSTDDDTLITGLITKARRVIENFCNVSMVVKTITLIADLYREWELPYGPVQGISEVSTRSANEGSGPALYETATTDWKQDGSDFKTFIPTGVVYGFNPSQPYRGYDQWGPYASPYGNVPGNRYRIVYTAGPYTPDDLVQAVLVQLVWLYEHRGEELGEDICIAARILAEPYVRRLWI